MTSSEPIHDERIEQKEKEDLEVLHTFSVLNRWAGNGYRASLIPRLVKTRAGIFFDLREYNQGTNFTGFTRRGLRLKVSDVQGLLELLPEIETKMLEMLQARKTA